MTEEIWKDIPGYEGLYQASNLGRIRRISCEGTPRNGNHRKLPFYLKARNTVYGYHDVRPYKNKKSKNIAIHRLVYLAFCGDIPKGKVINHKDGNKINNCIENLECVSPRYNALHAHKNKLVKTKYGLDRTNTKLSEKQILEIRQQYKDKKTPKQQLAKQFNISVSHVTDIISGKKRRDILLPEHAIYKKYDIDYRLISNN